MPPSGTNAPVADEKEKFAAGGVPDVPEEGSCVESAHVPGVASKPAFVINPVPVTVTLAGEPPWEKMEDETRLNTYPPTDQKLATGPELKGFGAKNVAPVPGATAPADKVDKITCGRPTPPGPVQEVIAVAVPAELVFRVTPPANVMLPVIGTACTLAVKITSAATIAALVVNLFFMVFVFFNGLSFLRFSNKKGMDFSLPSN